MSDATEADRRYLRAAVELAKRCAPSTTAFSVGALLVDSEGTVLATGYSRENDQKDHAEESALGKIDPSELDLAGATMYTSLEPCSTRASRPLSCTRLILDAGIRRVVFAWSEPALFVNCEGAELLRADGCTVIEIDELAPLVRATNAHLPGVHP